MRLYSQAQNSEQKDSQKLYCGAIYHCVSTYCRLRVVLTELRLLLVDLVMLLPDAAMQNTNLALCALKSQLMPSQVSSGRLGWPIRLIYSSHRMM